MEGPWWPGLTLTPGRPSGPSGSSSRLNRCMDLDTRFFIQALRIWKRSQVTGWLTKQRWTRWSTRYRLSHSCHHHHHWHVNCPIFAWNKFIWCKWVLVGPKSVKSNMFANILCKFCCLPHSFVVDIKLNEALDKKEIITWDSQTNLEKIISFVASQILSLSTSSWIKR